MGGAGCNTTEISHVLDAFLGYVIVHVIAILEIVHDLINVAERAQRQPNI
jgi:hypothetical protein